MTDTTITTFQGEYVAGDPGHALLPPVPAITVQEALAQASLEVGAVGKNARMEAGPARYSYRSLDDLIDAVHEPLARNGVIFAPYHIVVFNEMEKTTRSGSTQYQIRALVSYRIYGPSGDFIESTVASEAADTGDKGLNKLMSAAYKYCISQVLSLPYSMEDQDASQPEQVKVDLQIHDTGDAITAIEDAADRLDKTLAEVTAKLRAQNGAIGPDELGELPFEVLKGFAEKLTIYASKQQGA